MSKPTDEKPEGYTSQGKLTLLANLRFENSLDFPEEKGYCSRRSSRPLVSFRGEFEDGFPSPTKSDVESASNDSRICKSSYSR
jgi:hypothetical protein